MQILISVDIEGVAGVYHPEQTRAGNPEYERARRLMLAEANAAIAGAFDAGASAVYVNDSHGGFRNLPPELLDERAQAIQGKPRYLSMAAGCELGVAGMVCIGYHSRSKGRGILAHTINSFAFARIAFNGQELGELGIYGLLAGQYGVPVLAASGDDAFIEEHRALLPATEFIQVKRASGFGSGISLSPQAACAAIRAGVVRAVARASQVPVWAMAGPIEVTLQAQTPALADLFCQWPTLQRCDGERLRFTAPEVESAVRMINCLSAMSSMLR
ncbi:M55 family metallopeptidase [Melaminivora sp.]